MKIEDFAVEMWMNAYETKCLYNLAETCVDSITFGDLMAMSGKGDGDPGRTRRDEAHLRGHRRRHELRTAIASLYDGRTADEVLVTQGPSAPTPSFTKLSLDWATTWSPSCRLTSSTIRSPKAHGARVAPVAASANRYLPDLAELEALVTPATKLIAVTNPNNPTGALMDEAMLAEIVRDREPARCLVALR